MINCEYFNNLNGNMYYSGDMYIPILIPVPIEKVGDSSYPYPYPVNLFVISTCIQYKSHKENQSCECHTMNLRYK